MKNFIIFFVLISTITSPGISQFAKAGELPTYSSGGSSRRQTVRRQIDSLRNRITRAEDDIRTNEETKARINREITQNNPVPYNLADHGCNCRVEADACNRSSSEGGCSTGTGTTARLCLTPRGTTDCLKVFRSSACVDTLDENGRANVSQCWKVLKWQQVQDADNQIGTLRAQIETNNSQMARLEERLLEEDDGDCEGPECRGGGAAKVSVARTADRSPTLLDYAPYILGGLGMYLNYSNQSEWREGMLGLAAQSQDIYSQNYSNYAATAMRLDQSILPPTAMGGMFGAMMGAGGGSGAYNYQTAGIANLGGAAMSGIGGQGAWGNIANMAVMGGLGGYAGLAAGAAGGGLPGLNANLGLNFGLTGLGGNGANGAYAAFPGLYGAVAPGGGAGYGGVPFGAMSGTPGFMGAYSGIPYGAAAGAPGFANMYSGAPFAAAVGIPGYGGAQYGAAGVPGFANMYSGAPFAAAAGVGLPGVYGGLPYGPGAGTYGNYNGLPGVFGAGSNVAGYGVPGAYGVGAVGAPGLAGLYPAAAGNVDANSIFGNTAFNGSFVGNPMASGFPGVQGLTAMGGVPIAPGFPGVMNNTVAGPNVQGGPFSQQFPGGPMFYPGGPVALGNGANNATVMNSYGQSAAFIQQQINRQQQELVDHYYNGEMAALSARVQTLQSERARYVQLLYSAQATTGLQQPSANYYAAFAAPGSAAPKPPEFTPGQPPAATGNVLPNTQTNPVSYGVPSNNTATRPGTGF